MSIVREITKNIMQHNDDPLILVVSNPADIITAAVLQESGLHRGRVIGSGTSLDTARFRYLISEALGLDVADVSAYVLGEHGDSQVPIWSEVTIAGIPLDVSEEQMDVKVAMAVSNIVENLLYIQSGIVPVAHLLDKRYGDWAGVVISMPCILNTEGVSRTLNIPMTDEEKEKMDASVNVLKEFQRSLGLLA